MSVDFMCCDALALVLTGLSEYTVLSADEAGDELSVEVIASLVEAACPGCGEFSTSVKAIRSQAVRDVPHAGRRVRLTVHKRSFRCRVEWCQRRSFTPQTNELGSRRRTTTRCRELIGRAGKDRSTLSVAREYGVSWATAWKAVMAVAVRELGCHGRRIPEVLGVDETRFWWKQPWLTGLVDLSNSDLLEMVCGRSSDTLKQWVSGLTDTEKAMIRVVVIDPHAGYRAALRDALPDAVIVGDRFHFELLTGTAMTDVRRRRIWEQQAHRGRKTDPGWRARRDLLRRPDRLSVNGWTRVVAAMRTDTGTDSLEGELLWAWGARQYLAEIYRHATDRAHAHRMLVWWYCWITDHPVPELVRLATTISRWENEFLAYFDHRITNGRTEGRNRTIKHVKRLGYGYRNTPNYTLKCRYRALRLTSWNAPAGTPLPR